ncbi:MAG: hypothetical protein ACKVP2_02335 [Burkholderiales bacterium]
MRAIGLCLLVLLWVAGCGGGSGSGSDSPPAAGMSRDLTAFAFLAANNPGLGADVVGVIAGTSISLTVPFGTNVQSLVANFSSTGAGVTVGAATQVSGTTANSFSASVVYRVTAGDASFKDYTVSVAISPSTAKDITAFVFLATNNLALGADVVGVIAGTSISLTVPFGTNVQSLVANFTSTGAGVTVAAATQVSGTTANNFTAPVVYRVTAGNASFKEYTVSVAISPSTSKDITAFLFLTANNAGLSADVVGVIAGTSISLTVPFGTNVQSLVANFTSTGAGVTVSALTQVSGTTANNFSAPVVYRVTAGDSLTKDYTVTVTIAAALARVAVGAGLGNAGIATGTFPALLSQTGVFTNLVTLAPHPALVPFAVNAQLWSDNAVKTRWIAVPNDGAPYAASEQIVFSATGNWTFPEGTVTVKHFELVVNELIGQRKRLETRIGVLRNNPMGQPVFTGASYKWNAGQTDANLVTSAVTEINNVVTASGTIQRSHTYPSAANCTTCHRISAGRALGIRTHQLNGSYTYPGGAVQNQLEAWGQAGLFNGNFVAASIPTYLRTVAITDTAASLETRVRSYFEANCSDCHHPGGSNNSWDARFATPLNMQGIVGNVVTPSDPDASPLYRRMSFSAVDTPVNANQMMPPLAKNHTDTYALDVVRSWILSLP